jgi:hypothetical protein
MVVSIIMLCACLGGGIALAETYQQVACDDCKSGYNPIIMNGKNACAVFSEEIVNSYDPCYVEYIQPWFAIGNALAIICFAFLCLLAVVSGSAPIIICMRRT